MPRYLKTLLLWLLMLALPVQGFAAAIGLSCGSAHQHEVAAAVAALQHADSHADHDHTHANASAAIDAQDHHGADSSSPDHHASASTCSACAACCVGAVIPPSSLNLHSDDHGIIAPVAAATSSFVGHIPDGPKRPPKSSLI